MAAALLLFVIAASFTVVRVGAAAFELTGMSWEQAKFQALSAFTNAGFTTSEAEDVVRHPIRRRIAAYLIILGNAGLVTTIGTFAGSIVGGDPLEFGINMAVMTAGVGVLFWVARKPRIAQKMRDSFQRRIRARYGDLVPTAEALLRLDEGLELTRVNLTAKSPAVGRTLAQLGLKDVGIQVLAIERDGEFNPTPGGNDSLEAGDSVVLYGRTERAHEIFGAAKTQSLTIIPGDLHADDVVSADDVQRPPPGASPM